MKKSLGKDGHWNRLSQQAADRATQALWSSFASAWSLPLGDNKVRQLGAGAVPAVAEDRALADRRRARQENRRRISSPMQGMPTSYQPSEAVGGMAASMKSRGGSGAPLIGDRCAPSEAWRFLRGERPRLIRSNQPPVPSVAYPAEAERR